MTLLRFVLWSLLVIMASSFVLGFVTSGYQP